MTVLRFFLAAASCISTISALPQPMAEEADVTNYNMPFLSSTPAMPAASQSDWGSSATESQWVPSPTAYTWISAPYSNPFTIYTTMTNSEGVITGMPAVWTSQPPVPTVTSVASGVASVESQQASWSSMVASLYPSSAPMSSMPMVNATATMSQTSTSTSSASALSQSQYTNGAQQKEIKLTSAGLILAGLSFALL